MAEHGLSAARRSSLPADLLGLGLVFALLAAAVTGMSSALQGPDWAALWLCALLGLLLAWLLARLHLPVYAAALLLAASGAALLLLVPAGLAGKLADLAASLFRWLVGRLPFHAGGRIGPEELNRLAQGLVQSTGIVLQRVRTWLTALAAGKPAFDPLAASLAWNALVWVVATWAGWLLAARRAALAAVAPAVLLSLGTLSYGRRMSSGLYLVLGLSLLVLALVQQEGLQQHWNAGGAAYPARKGRQVLQTAFGLTLGLVLLSAALPSFSIQRLRHWIDSLRQPPQAHSGSLAGSLGLLPGGTPVADVFQSVRSPGLPREHLIGAGPDLSEKLVMTVRVDDLSALSQGGQTLPLYWRGFTYDVYTGEGWSSSATTGETLEAGQPIQSERLLGRLLVRQKVLPAEDLGGTIFAAGEPVSFDLPGQAAWRGPGDLFGVRSAATTAYTIDSLVPVVAASSLRSAGERYPDWVRQRFLALPDGLPERVQSLALRLTAAAPTPYDRAVAIEDYLRTYPYTLDVPYPPAQQDVVDYFLFDLKKGYCDYFASAMVVLARASGLPARLAVGYATGTYNLNSKVFAVSEADAHSWAEIYFPGYGWVPFEATPSRPPLDRTQALVPETPTQPTQPSGTTATSAQPSLPWAWSVSAGLLLAILLGLAGFGLDQLHLQRLPAARASAEIYRRLRRAGWRLGVQADPGSTPYEFGRMLRDRLARLDIGREARLEELLASIVRTSFRPASSGEPGPARGWARLRLELGWIEARLIWKSLTERFSLRPDRYSQTGRPGR